MRDSLNTLFQQRFQGHEAPVDAGVWEGIQQQLATAPAAADGVNELFKERFQGHEAPVDPAVWANISSQLGHTAVAGTAAGTVWAWVAAGTAAVVITATALFWEPGANEPQQVVQVVEVKEEVSAPLQITPEQVLEEEVAGLPKVSTPQRSTSQAGVSTKVRTKSSSSSDPDSMSDPTTGPADQWDKGIEPTTDGHTVVDAIIMQLEEGVKQTPITAQPEPGLPVQTVSGKKSGQGAEDQDRNLQPEEPQPLQPLPKLFMPNTFTPNGDGVNDHYMVDGEGYEAVMVRVYSMKTNALVFSTHTGEPWTGDGCEDGMYMVAVEAHTSDNRAHSEGKVVWLTRNRMN